MRAPHQIQQATLSFNFDNALQAEQFERQAHRWTTEQLLPLIEQIFERFNPNHDVITIDRLELDLGKLVADSLPGQLLNAIEVQLCDKLGHYLSPNPQTPTTNVQRFSPDAYQWQQAIHFLQTGYLPWSAQPSQPHQPFDLGKITLEHIDELNQFLTQLIQPHPLLVRLTYQLSAPSLAQLIEQLAPDLRQIALNQLVCLEKRHHPRLKQTISHHFQRLLSRALEQHRLSELILSHWETWVSEYSNALIATLKSHHQDAQLPYLLCEQLSESQRFRLLEHIEPAEYPFLYRVLTHPQIWYPRPDKPIIAKPQPVAHIQQQLWLFTLHYLLVERGSRFNRQNYMHTLLEQMAACQNLHTNQLIGALRCALSTLDIDSALQRQMLSLLSIFSTRQGNPQPNIEQFNQMVSPERQQWLLHTLLSGDITPLLPQLLEQHHAMLISTLSYLTNTPRLRQQLNTQLTYQTKRAILRSIHPNEKELLNKPTQVTQQWDQQFTPHKPTVQTAPETDAMLALVSALQSGQEHQLQTHWPENQHEFKKLLRWIGQLAAIRQHWAEHYSDPMLLKLTDVIEPAAHDDIQMVTHERRLFAAMPSKHQSRSELTDSTLRISLWQFTLSYLLLEQESHFNRQSYLQSLITQMAARRNISQAQLLAAMLKLLQQHTTPVLLSICQSLLQPWQTLRLSDKERPEQQTMLAIIDHWQQETIRPGRTSQKWFGLIQALTEANSSKWQTHFNTLTDQDFPPLKTLLNRLGQQEYARHRWAERFDDATLQGLVGLIAPDAVQIVDEVIEHPHIFSAPVTKSPMTTLSEQALKQSLWEFTFTYLLIERGSEFNRKSYLQSLTRQMAARRNVRQEQLILAMLQLLHQRSHSLLCDTLDAILQPLTTRKTQDKTYKCLLDEPLTANQAQSVPSHLSDKLLPVFQVGLSLWKSAHSSRLLLRKEHALTQLQQFGQQANIRQQWIQQFNDATLLALVRFICPDALQTIQSVISDDSSILLRSVPSWQTTITSTALRQMLWTISLNYLFIESGSAFHRQHYLRSLGLQLARHHNMQQQQWIHTVLNSAIHLPDWFSALQSLCDPHIPLQPAQTKWLQNLQQGHSPEKPLSAEQIQSIRQQLTIPGHHRWQFQQFPPLSQRLLIHQLAPDVYPTLKKWLPELTRILANLTLTPNWFYQTLFASHPPQSRSQWLYALLTHLKQIFPDQCEAQLVARLQSLMEDKMNPTHDEPWLHSLQTPLELISQWLNSNQQPPAMWIIHQAIREYPTALWQQLSTVIQPRQALLRWIDALDDDSHKQLFAFKYPHLLTDILRLHLKVNILLEQTSQVHCIFWEVLYQRLLLQGYQGSPDHFSQQILTDLAGHPVVKDTLSPHQLSTLFKDIEVLSPRVQDTAPIPEDLPLDKKAVHPLYEAITLQKAPSSEKILYQNDASEPHQISGPIAVNNAGIVLAATYIPMLFDRLDFTQDKQFISQDTQHQALFCLQLLVDDIQETPEYQLVLNKVLCGIPIESPIERDIPLPDKAIEIIKSMLNAMIEHWHALGSTSIEGLRTTFIQRNGQLKEENENWQLDITPGPYDVLLDQLPWSFQTIKYPWMNKPLFVYWR
ncbi:MAG: hypothetical protein CENE_01740 [Candidatus Celerinatantimonas neptuna]|nr:MAG: hypothetical protein CENE_01740 [Candidatus Celerinatantimonas neptuna]